MPAQERSGLIVPVVLWGKKKLKNRICVVTPINNGRMVVTGSLDGQVIQWTVDERGGLIRPHMMMIAHETSITCISATSLGANSTRYVTCSLDGQVCLWDSVDGRAVDSVRHSYVHRKIVPYSYRVSSHHIQTRLFCIGDYAEIIVMDSQDLNIIFSLSSRVESDWISALTIVHPPDKSDVVIGISISGMIKLWSLNDIDKKDASSIIYEDESKIMNVRNVQTISCSTLNTRMMLVISPTNWQIVDPSNLNQLIISECSIEAVHGIIIDIDKVAIGFSDSTIVLFQLPRAKLTGKQVTEKFGEKPRNVGNIEHPFVFALLKGVPTTPLTPLSSTVSFYFDTRIVDNHLRRVAYRADHQGKVDVWHIPRKFDPLVEEFLRSKRPVIYDPTMRQSFEEMWPKLVPTPPAIADLEDDLKVTATTYLGNQGKLLLGREDGSIVMMYACHAIMSQLLYWNSPDPVQHRILLGHSAAVTCFLYPFEESTRYDPQLLLSGGMDFTVIVWNIMTGSRVYRFCCQGGPILRMLTPPDNCTPWVLHTICAIAEDNSAALLSLKENKCVLLASRHMFPIVDVKWRPLDDLMLVRCEDESVYVWQMDTANLDRIVTGLHGEDVIDACKEQVGLVDVEDEAGASQAVQMLRALKNKNISAVKKIATGDKSTAEKDLSPTILPSPMDVIQLKKCSDQAHLVLFNVDALIMGLLSMDYEITHQHSNHHSAENTPDRPSSTPSLANLIQKKTENVANGHPPGHHHTNVQKVMTGWQPNTPGSNERSRSGTPLAHRWASESNLYMDTARLLISLIHAWNLDENLDTVCAKKLKLHKPKVPISYGLISRRGHISLYLPKALGKDENPDEMTYYNFSKNSHWKLSSALTTIHLVSSISLANILMSLRSRSLHLVHRKSTLKRVSSTRSTESGQESESQQIKQGWSNVAAMHCVLLPDLVKPSTSYMSPKIELLARRWQDNCIEIRDASQALLIRELNRLGLQGRRILIDTWAPFLPTLLDPTLSIFGHLRTPTIPSAIGPNSFMAPNPPGGATNTPTNAAPAQDGPGAASGPQGGPPRPPPPRPAPPLPPRPAGGGHPPLPEVASPHPPPPQVENPKAKELQNALHHVEGEHMGGVHQVRRNQATAIILLGVMGAEFAHEMHLMADLARATAHSLLELLIAPETPLLPLNSPLRRAAIDLIGRGFVVWQPHLDISKVLLGLLDLAASSDRHIPQAGEFFGAPLSPAADACRTARHALSLIASARPQALITALSMEVARYNAAAQHQTIQHAVVSPLLKSRAEVLRIIEQLSEKQYNDVADLIIPVGDILVHCLDTSLLKQRTLSEIFPPIAKFYMVGYCPTTRRIAFGGKNGTIVIHELKASKAQNIHAHKSPITALAFSQDGKYLASYSSKDAKLSFWQSQQTFLGMGQNQIRCVKTLDAPSEFPVLSPGGTYQVFRARLVWINAKSLTLMLPNGKENRFSI